MANDMRKGIDLVEIDLSRWSKSGTPLMIFYTTCGALRRGGVEAAMAGILSLNVLRLGTHEVQPQLSSTGPNHRCHRAATESLLGLPLADRLAGSSWLLTRLWFVSRRRCVCGWAGTDECDCHS